MNNRYKKMTVTKMTMKKIARLAFLFSIASRRHAQREKACHHKYKTRDATQKCWFLWSARMNSRGRQASPAASADNSSSTGRSKSRTSATPLGKKRLTKGATPISPPTSTASSAATTVATAAASKKQKGAVKSSPDGKRKSSDVAADTGLAIVQAIEKERKSGTTPSSSGANVDLGPEEQTYRDPAPLKWRIFEAAAKTSGQRYNNTTHTYIRLTES